MYLLRLLLRWCSPLVPSPQGLPIIGFAEYKSEQKKRCVEEQRKAVAPRPGMHPLVHKAKTVPTQRFIIGDITFDTALEPAPVVASRMDALARSLVQERRDISTRLLAIEQQERSLRAAMQALKTS